MIRMLLEALLFKRLSWEVTMTLQQASQEYCNSYDSYDDPYGIDDLVLWLPILASYELVNDLRCYVVVNPISDLLPEIPHLRD